MTSRMHKELRFSYRDYIEHEFGERHRRNPNYSLRAFARDLEILPSKLSEVLRAKSGLSTGSAKALARRLKLEDDEADYFVALVEAEHSRGQARRLRAQARLDSIRAVMGYKEISLESFAIISDWVHFAILELTEVHDFNSNEKWIAKRLQVPLEEVGEALSRLLKSGLLSRDEKGRLRQTDVDIATPGEIPARSKRDHHRQILSRAIDVLERIDVSRRDFSSTTMAVDSSQIDEAKRAILDFRREFAKKFQKKSSKDRVCCLAIQFFPLDYIGQETVQ